MPDNVLSFTTQVDLSGLKSGMAQVQSSVQAGASAAASSVEQFSARARAAQDAYNAAAKGTVEVQKALGAAFDQAGAQGKSYVEALESAVAAVSKLDVAEKEETTTLRNSLSPRMAAAAELRTLEGNIQGSTRAAAAFLTTIPGIGKAMQVAFPIFGAVALVEVLADAARGVEHLVTAFHDLKGAETDAATAAILAGEKVLTIKPDKLSVDAMARFLERVPQNSSVQIQNESAALKQIEYQRQLADIAAQNNEMGLTGTALEKQKTLDLQKEAQFARDAAAQTQKLIDSYTSLLSATEGKGTSHPIVEGLRTAIMPGGVGSALNEVEEQQRAATRKITDPAQIKAIQDQIRTAEQALQQFKQDATVAVAKIPGVANKEGADADKEALKAAQQQLKDIENLYTEQNLAKVKITGSGLTAGEGASFWSQYLSTFKTGSEEYKRVLEEVTKYTEENHKNLTSELKKYQEEQTSLQREGMEADRAIDEIQKQRIEAYKKQQEEAAKAAKEYRTQQEEAAQSTHEANLGGIQQKEAGIESQQQLGIIDPKVALQQLQDLHLQEEKEEERFIAAMKIIDAGQVEDQKRLQKELEDSQRKSQLQQMKDTTKILAQEESEYRKAFSLITNDFNNALLQWQTHETTASQAFSKMLLSMETGVEKLVLQFIEGQLEKELLKLLTSMLGISSASTSNVNQTQLNSDKVVNPQIVESNAAAAASVVFLTSGGDIAAALETYAAGMVFYPLAAYEAGGIVGGSHGMPVPIMAHAGERVLSAPQTQNFERMVNQPAKGGGSSVHVNYSPNINAFDRSGWRSMLAANKGDILDLVRQAVKTGALG